MPSAGAQDFVFVGGSLKKEAKANIVWVPRLLFFAASLSFCANVGGGNAPRAGLFLCRSSPAGVEKGEAPGCDDELGKTEAYLAKTSS